MELKLFPHQKICVEKGIKILREYNLLYTGLKMRLELDLYRATQSKVWNKNRTYIFEIVYNV